MSVPLLHIVCGAGIVSGKEIISLHLARGLRASGWEVELMISSWSDGEFMRRLKHDGFRYQCLRLGFISASLGLAPILMTLDQIRYWPVLAYRYVRLVMTRVPVAVIHTNWHHALLLLPFLRPHRDVFWVHELVPNVPRYAYVLCAIARRVGRVVCVSHAVARSIIAVGVHQEKVTVIHNGIPPVGWSFPPLRQRTLRLGIVGQVGPWKGHDDLLDALALLLREGTVVSLIIFGTGEASYVESLKRRASDLGLVERVEWRGFVLDQAEIFGAIDVCVVPSRVEEALGMTAIEASGFGHPVICSARGGLPEVVKDGSTGFVVEAKRPEQLAEAIKSFVQHPDRIRTMGDAAREHIQRNFSIEQCVEKFIRVIHGLRCNHSAY
jgi:glycosyltransferase involved in cell wall biosynthesis